MAIEYKNSLVYLVDDDPAILDSLGILIKQTGLKTISFESSLAFLNGLCPEQPACLVLDVKIPLMDGLELQQELSKRNIKIPIIFISGNAEISDAAKAFKAGAVDFLEKPFDPNQLIERIFTVLKKDAEDRGSRLENGQIQSLFYSLSPREREVLQLIVSNHSSKEAARKLQISPRTIEAHRKHIMEKLQTSSLSELVGLTIKHSPF